MMKTKSTSLRLSVCAALAGLLAPLTTFAGATPTTPTRLQVHVETPTIFDLTREQDVADALAYRMQETFRRAGFEGRIAQIDDPDEASADAPLITLRLIDWRQGHTGFVDCRLVATMTRADGSTETLGTINGTAVTMGHVTRFDRADAFADAADNAMRDLWQRYQKLHAASAAIAATPAIES